MLSLASLKDAIKNQLADAESKRSLAESLMKKAEDHEAREDHARAKIDRDSAERYLRDVKVIEDTIAGYETEIIQREQKITEIDKQISELTQRHEHNLEQLEGEKKSVKLAILTMPELEAAQRQVQNSRIDNKQEELQKHYQRDLDRLQRERANLAG